MKVTDVKIEDIRPYEKNPRFNDEAVDTVAKSIKRYGWKQPLVIDENGVIIAGHTRYKAALKLGLDTVPCVLADDLTEEEQREYRLVDNKTAELAQWNFPMLEDELEGLSFGDLDLDWMPQALQSDVGSGTKEYNLDDFGDEQFEHECPRCGFKF